MFFLLLSFFTLYLLAGIIYFAYKKPYYSHLKHTISELGEDNAINKQKVNLGLFLPVGLALVMGGLLAADNKLLQGFACCVGAAYIIAAFFPCDAGSPVSGSWKQSVHNIGGFIEYAGGIYFFSKAREQNFAAKFTDSELLIVILVVCLVLTSIQGFKFRGLAQRIAELVLFWQILWLSQLS